MMCNLYASACWHYNIKYRKDLMVRCFGIAPSTRRLLVRFVKSVHGRGGVNWSNAEVLFSCPDTVRYVESQLSGRA